MIDSQTADQNQQQHHQLLNLMGIDTFNSREAEQIRAVTSYHSVPFLNDKGGPLGQLLADADPCQGNHGVEQKLLTAIAFALQGQTTVQPCQILSLSEGVQTAQPLMILLGSAVTQHVLRHVLGRDTSFYAVRGQCFDWQSGRVVVSFALSDLLAKPLLKAELWQTLQCMQNTGE